LAAPTGTEGSVGLAGATLGGGFGLLTRRFGMASDNLLAAEVVVAPAGGGATAVIADEHNNTDLLWALRGAGNGNFGIVTSLTYAIHPLAQAIYITATWTGLDGLPGVFAAWQRSAPYADDRLTSQLEIRRDEIMLVGALASGSQTEAMQMLAPSWRRRSRFSSLRDRATTVKPMAVASCTEATPTPPDAPVTSTTEAAGSSPHMVSAW